MLKIWGCSLSTVHALICIGTNCHGFMCHFLNYNWFQSKIRELEEKLREEAHQRKLVQDKTAEVNSNDCFSINTQVIISKKRKKNISTRNHFC